MKRDLQTLDLGFPDELIIDNFAGGGPYALLSGLKLVALDEFGILDLASRTDCIAGLDALAEAGKIDTALVFGTFKKLPNFTSFHHVTGWWVEGGRITETTAVEAAAA